MDPPNPNKEDDDLFFDALDDFPFYDCIDTQQSQPSTSVLTDKPQISTPYSPSETPYPETSLRRRRIHRSLSSKEEKPILTASLDSKNSLINDTRAAFRQHRRYRITRNFKENDKGFEMPTSNQEQVSSFPLPGSLREQSNEDSTITTAGNEDPVGDSSDPASESGDSSFNFLVFIAGFLIKAIGFQVNLLVMFITFPIVFIYNSYIFFVNPFQTLRRGRAYLIEKLVLVWDTVCGYISPSLPCWLKQNKSIWKVALRFGWGMMWSVYVCFILFNLLAFSLVISGVIMKHLVEEPFRMREVLNFDYTKHSPVAYVPIISCAGVGCGEDCQGKTGNDKNVGVRIIPPNHRLQATISLVLPESEYNRNLGIFQIRVEFLSAHNKTLASLSRPCMLHFKSEPIRLILTFFKIAPLVTGYLSESQTLNMKMRGNLEGDVPAACLKVMIEQRAEFQRGAGIPEIYDAYVLLESELPFLKRIAWYWKKTLYVWLTMLSFMLELLFALVCCRPIIIPRPRRRDESSQTRAIQNNS